MQTLFITLITHKMYPLQWIWCSYFATMLEIVQEVPAWILFDWELEDTCRQTPIEQPRVAHWANRFPVTR